MIPLFRYRFIDHKFYDRRRLASTTIVSIAAINLREWLRWLSKLGVGDRRTVIDETVPKQRIIDSDVKQPSRENFCKMSAALMVLRTFSGNISPDGKSANSAIVGL